MGKRKVLSESNLKELVLPQEGELLGRVNKIASGDHVVVKCVDGKIRFGRIRGKMKRRVWIREHDIVLVAPWDFDDDKADVLWRYIKAHEEWLAAHNYLPPGF